MAPNHNRITHYIPPAKIEPIVHEFIEPVPNDYFIWWLFGHRCMECKRPGTEINEIVPRSRSKKSVVDWRNRVVLCRECHTQYHKNGVTTEKMQIMAQHRKDYLVSIGKGKYL